MSKYHLASAANILIPNYYLLKEKGFNVYHKEHFWIAENEDLRLVAEDLLMLAGLAYLYENKGEEWRVDDGKIDQFLERHKGI